MNSQGLLQTAERLLRRREVGPLLGLGILVLIFGTMSSNLFTRQQVGGITALTTFIGAYGIDHWLGLVLALAVAAFIGLANGVVTTWFGIPSFITTLAAFLVVG